MAAIGAGVLGLLCLSSSVCSAMSGGGDEETPDQTVVVPDTEVDAKAEAEAEAEAETKTEAKAEVGFGTDTVKGQYVRLWQGDPYQSQKAYALTILELEVYDNSGTNIAQGKSATSSSQYPGDHQPVLAFDGSLDTKYRSNYDVEEDWLEVDLGSVIEIHKIVIKHTGSEDVYEGVAMKDGLRGYIEIFDGNGSIGKTTQIAVTSTDDVYTYNFKERGGGKWRGGQGLLKSREDIIAKKQASDAAAAEAKAAVDAAAEKAAAEKAAAKKRADDKAKIVAIAGAVKKAMALKKERERIAAEKAEAERIAAAKKAAEIKKACDPNQGGIQVPPCPNSGSNRGLPTTTNERLLELRAKSADVCRAHKGCSGGLSHRDSTKVRVEMQHRKLPFCYGKLGAC